VGDLREEGDQLVVLVAAGELMSIKLIAVDMDGTFLSDAKTYNRPRFLAQYQRTSLSLTTQPPFSATKAIWWAISGKKEISW
jgi:hypothetical protein